MTDRFDVAVVGGGAMGLAAAWRLALAGRSVALFEQHGPGHDRGSSHGTTRIFRLGYEDPAYVRLGLAAIPLWRELEAASGLSLLELTGAVDHGPVGALEALRAAFARTGVASSDPTPPEATERWPGLRFDDDVLVHDTGGRVRADLAVAALWQVAAAAGAALHHDLPVIDVDPAGAVRTEAGETEADVVVLAAGAWLARLAPPGLDLPALRVTQEQPAHFRPLDVAAVWPSFIHRRPVVGSLASMATYGLAGPDGVKVGEHGTGVEVDPHERPPADPGRLERLCRHVATWYPGLDPAPLSVTTCLYTTTPDEAFVLRRRGRLVVCSPCSGHGFKFVPAIGQVVADLVVGGVDRSWPRMTDTSVSGS